MENRSLIISILALSVLALTAWPFVNAGMFLANEMNNPTGLYAGTIRLFNISINNTDVRNITNVTILLPAEFTFLSNNSNSGVADFISYSNGSGTYLAWSNATITTTLLPNGTNRSFLFRARLPTSAGTYTITIFTMDNSTNNQTNVTRINFTVTGAVSSRNQSFSTDKTVVYFNVSSNASLLVEANENTTSSINYTISVNNFDTNITPTYFQIGDYPQGRYPGLNGTSRTTCFTVGMDFFVKNSTFNLNNSDSTLLSQGNRTMFYLTPYLFCPPGLYRGSFYVSNSSYGRDDNVSIEAAVHIPISEYNTYQDSNQSAFFLGNGSGGDQPDNAYYFYTNMSSQSTGVTINLTGMTQDVDLFLLNGSGLLDKSILRDVANDEIFSFLPASSQLWEIRVSRALSSYTGFLFFTPLNVTNGTNQTQGWTSLPFGVVLPNSSVSLSYNLSNLPDRPQENVLENREVWMVNSFGGQNASTRFSFFVPNFATKIRAGVIWANESNVVTDWDLVLIDNNGILVLNSTNKTTNANASNLQREEYVVYSGPFNSSVEGYWNVQIVNRSIDTVKSFYNVTVLVYMNSTLWLNTSFNQSTDFNQSSASSNTSFFVVANITPPTPNILNGTFGGMITYFNGSGWTLKLPLSFQLSLPFLIVDGNATNTTEVVTDNVGVNETKIISFNFTVNNTGSQPLHFRLNTSNTFNGSSTNTSSTGFLVLTSNSSKALNFTVFAPTSPLAPGSSARINVSVSFTVNQIIDTVGIYQGFLFFNTTNVTNPNSASYPYQFFNVTLKLNLSDRLNATIYSINLPGPMNATNTTASPYINYSVQARLLNTSVVSVGGGYYPIVISNFLSSALIEGNTSNTYVLSGLSSVYGQQVCGGGSPTNVCDVSYTLPSILVGGRYTAQVVMNYAVNNVTNLTGTATALLLVNNSGINMSSGSTSIGNLNEGSSTTFNVTVGNLGATTASSVRIAFNYGSCPITVSAATSGAFSSGCSITSSSNPFTLNIDPFTATSAGCALRFSITGNSVSGDTACTTMNVTADQASFNNITGISLTVKETSSSNSSGSSGSGSGSGSGSSPSGCTSNAACASTEYCSSSVCTALDCESYEYISNHACVAYDIRIVEYPTNLTFPFGGGAQAKVKVEEANNKTVTAKLVTTLTDFNTSVSPASCVSPCTFTVDIASTSATEVKAYTGTFTTSLTVFPEVDDSKTFTVSVLPTEEKKAEISQKFQDTVLTIVQLTSDVNTLKGSLSQENATLIQTLLDTITAKQQEIQSALDAGDYVTANTLMSGLESSISQLQTKMSELRAGVSTVGFELPVWIIVIVVAAAGLAFVAYLLLPPKTEGKKPTTGKKSFLPAIALPKSLPKFSFKKKKPAIASAPLSDAKSFFPQWEAQPFVYKKKGKFGFLKKKDKTK